ncbi:MAG: bacteriohemerythrin [Lachnospiraceae bacterium]|nr:bacteriohemerythrin [Lachnospiraceae bacterium]
MYYRFTDECLIGVDQIDDEHRELFRLVGEVQDLLNDKWTQDKYFEICDLIERLKEYAAEHFRHEEEYMEKIGHPELEMQRQQHADFCEKVDEVDPRSAEGEQQELISDLLNFLVKWLYKHIIGSDLLIGKLMSVEEWKQKEDYSFEEKYLTGVDSVDEEHRELFKILDEIHYIVVYDDTDEKYDKLVNMLKHFKNTMLAHLKSEEEYMESIQYEGLELQRLAHDVFSARLELLNPDEFDASRQTELEEWVEVLSEWVVTHVANMDVNIGRAQKS